MKLDIILQGGDETNDMAYLRVQIVDLGDGSINVTSMNSLSYLYAGLDGFFFERKLDVRFFGKLFSGSREAFADQVIHDYKVDVPVDVQLES
jgi:hypothetical protein